MVESAATKPAEMCLRLKAVHRWCVTGTPIQRELSGMWYETIISCVYVNMSAYIVCTSKCAETYRARVHKHLPMYTHSYTH